MKTVRCLAILALLVLPFAPGTVSAQTPVVRGMVGNGFDDAYGFGLGGSTGVEVPFIRGRQFFVGVRGLYHFGSEGVLSGFAPDGMPDPTGDVSQLQVGLEIGATWMTSPLFIRMVGGIGAARVDVNVASGQSDLDGVSTKLTYGPGLLVAIPSANGTFAGLELKYLKVSGLDSALAIYATLGRRLF